MSQYFSERRATVDTLEGKIVKAIHGGVPQGSVLGPLIWNILFDGVLRLRFPVITEVLADDLAVMIKDRIELEVTNQAARALRVIEDWMGEHKLVFAPEKCVWISLTGRRRLGDIFISIGGRRIQKVETAKYLVVVLDRYLSFASHLEYISKRADSMMKSLQILMSSKQVPRSSKRRVIASTAASVVLYASPVWEPAVARKKNLKLLIITQKEG